MKQWVRANHLPNLPLESEHRVTASPAHIELSRKAAEEGMVLLKNQDDLLPLSRNINLCLFGKGTFDYVKGGGGSGDVYTKYIRNIYDGLKELACCEIYEPLVDYYHRNVQEQYTNGAVPGMTTEPELPRSLLEQARQFSDIAVISISRFSGEGWDRSDVDYREEHSPWPDETSMPEIAGKIFPDGDFYLTAAEKTMILQVTEAFPKVVVLLNVGGVIDTSWIKNDPAIQAALLTWQGGMEGGLAAANLLFGIATPCGKLPDSFAAQVDDYPSTKHFHDSPHYVEYFEDIYVGYRYFETLPNMREKVCYPFGHGLSYTTFSIQFLGASVNDAQFEFKVRVQNTGAYPGKEVVQLYCEAPQGKLGKPHRVLTAFQKTECLAPGQEQTVILLFSKNTIASYDDLGLIHKAAYVLEQGSYRFYLGSDLYSAKPVDYCLTVEHDQIVEQLCTHLAPSQLEHRLRADGSYELLPQTAPNDPNSCIFPKMTPGTEEAIAPAARGRARYSLAKPYADGVHSLSEVAEGKLSLDEFMAQLSDDNLLSLLGGQSNLGVANTFGFGNLPEYGVPNVMTADGPAGLRLDAECGIATTAWPCGTLLASTWNCALVEQVGFAGGKEVKENNISVWLTPAINIHRNPLCGRNFEYYSEDPLLAGFIGSAMVRGIQKNDVAACVKHFAVNNKETNRKHSDSRLSERALREIYLKAFEIIVKTADPWTIMSSYNIINGHRASESHELLEDILRNEWGYQGVVTTDWWTRGEHYKEILAGNDIKMACGFPERVKQAQQLGVIGRKDYEHCARRVLELLLKIQ